MRVCLIVATRSCAAWATGRQARSKSASAVGIRAAFCRMSTTTATRASRSVTVTRVTVAAGFVRLHQVRRSRGNRLTAGCGRAYSPNETEHRNLGEVGR